MNRTAICSVVLAMTTLASSALAADPQAPAAATAPLPSDWSGFYVGTEGGYGWGHETLDSAHDSFGVSSGVGNITTIPAAPFATPTGSLPQFKAPDFGALYSADRQGGVVGGFAGVQQQRGNSVVGVEADVNGADIKGPPISYELNQIGTPHPNRR